ncbi:MAG: Rpn family recombination-promoting nuclease/putative transposase [Succinivibrio sp.]|nr:Rpn family recombination-promoting nuclease/putative transposase [Succinivibrio sp.]
MSDLSATQEVTEPPTEEIAARFSNLGFLNAFMFRTIMLRRQDLLKRILCVLLEEPELDLLDRPEFETTVYNGSKHSVRYDVRVRTPDGRVMLIEAQTYQEINRAWEQRSRFYNVLLDKDLLDSGKHYSALPEVRLIWLCLVDPFGRNLPCYTFRSVCKEDPSLAGLDRSMRMYFNALAYAQAASPEQRDLLGYCCDGQPRDDLTKELDMELNRVKNDPDELSRFNVWSIEADWLGRQKLGEGYRIGIEKGVEKGVELGREEGIKLGREEGIALGEQKGEDKLQSLIEAMIEAGKNTQELKEALDPNKRPALYKQYGITQD